MTLPHALKNAWKFPIFLVVLSGFALYSIAQTQTNSRKPLAPDAPQGVARYGNLPLSFEANQGQADARVRFLSRGSGYSLFLTDSEAVLSLGSPVCEPAMATCPATATARQDSMRMSLAGANPGVHAAGADQLPGKVNYFLGNDPAKWRAGLPTYAKVRLSGVYPGIDLVYYGNQRQLEYDFVVAPGASADAIRLTLSGQRRLRITAAGDLALAGENGTATLRRPVVYQQKNGIRQPIRGRFRLAPNHAVAFAIGSYDHTRPLIIDPVLVYSTYLGGSGSQGQGDQANGIAVDASGDAYIVGTAYSTDFPGTGTGFQATNNSALAGHGGTVFVSELNPTGTALLYSTYLGGSGGDFGYGIAVDSANNAYVTGATYSADFPVTCGGFQTVDYATANGAATGFVAKLNAGGSALVYSTYLGGTGNDAAPSVGDVAQAIAVDAAGDAFVTGYTGSSDFPATAGVFQPEDMAGAQTVTGFVTKVNPGGTALAYSTFLGGNGPDYGNAIAIDGSGDAYVAGSTASTNFPVTSGALQPANSSSASGKSTAFVTELNPAGAAEIFSTYLGGSGGDTALGIAVSGSGGVYLAGTTGSSDFPVSADALEGTSAGSSAYFEANEPSAFAAELKPGGSSLAYATYLEGAGTKATGVAVDSSGTAYLTGSTLTSGAGLGGFGAFQTTADALAVPAGSVAAFLVKLNPAGASFQYATLLGGSSKDGAVALALDGSGNAYVTGYASSTDFPVTSGALQTGNHAAASHSDDAFVSKLALAAETSQTTYPSYPATSPSSVPTSLTNVRSQFTWMTVAYPCDEYEIDVEATLNTGVIGPPPTGMMQLSGNDWEGYYTSSVTGSWGGATDVYNTAYGLSEAPGVVGGTPFWQLTYPGDSVYAQSSVGGVSSPGPCEVVETAGKHPAAANSVGHLRLHLQPGQPSTIPARDANSALVGPVSPGSTPANSWVPGPKFTPPAPAQEDGEAAIRPANSPVSCSLPILTVTLKAASRIYGVANPSFTYTLSGLMHGDTVAVTTQTTAVQSSPIGKYSLTAVVRGAALANYKLSVLDSALTVTPAPLTVTIRLAAATRPYGAANPALTYMAAGLEDGDTITVTPSTAATAASPVGTYPVTGKVTGATLANYTVSVNTVTLAVTPAPLLLYASHYSSTYGKTPPAPTAYKLTGFVNGDTASVVSGAPVLSIAAALSASTPVGDYPIQVAAGTLTASNYTIQIGTVPAQLGYLLIIPAALRVTVLPKTASRAYGAANPTYSDTFTGLLNGDAVTVTVAPPGVASPVGSYAVGVTLSGASAANYTPSVVNDATLTITAVPLTVTVLPAAASRAYGASNPTFTYSAVGLLNGDTFTPNTDANFLSPIGTYPVTVTGPALANYAPVTINPATLTVTPEPLVVTVVPASVSRFYGAANPSIGVAPGNLIHWNENFSASSLALNGSASLTAKSIRLTTANFSEAGSAYLNTPVPVARFNTVFTFQFTDSLSGGITFVLQNKGLNALGQGDGGLGYGPSSPGSPGGITPSVAIPLYITYNDNNGSAIEATGLYTDGANPETTPVDLTNADFNLRRGDLFQVQISYDGTNLTETITDTATLAAFTQVYKAVNLPQILGGATAYAGFTGGTDFEGNVQTDVFAWSYSDTLPPASPYFSYTVAGLVNGDQPPFTLSTAAAPTSPVGTYPETISGGTLLNYAVTFHGATLTVKPAGLSLAATSYKSTYGQTPLAPASYTLTGFVNGQTSSIVTGSPTLSITATAASPAGNYPIKAAAGTLSAPNYTVEVAGAQGVLEIAKAPLTLTANSLTMSQGGPIPPLTWSWTGFVNGDGSSTATTGVPNLSTTATTRSKPGSYPIYINLGSLKSSNYAISTADGTMTVLP